MSTTCIFGKFLLDKAPAETKKTRVLGESNIVKKEYIRRVSSFAWRATD
jgi:hypothetical protein